MVFESYTYGYGVIGLKTLEIYRTFNYNRLKMAVEIVVEHSNRERKLEPGRHFLARPIVYQLGIWGIGYLPKWFSYWFAKRIADISYLFYKKARQNVKNNLRRVFPDLSEKDISILTVNTFRNYSTYLVDYGRFKSLRKESLYNIILIQNKEEKENIEWALKRNKGIIILTAHLGNWELGGVFFGKQGIKINVLTFRDGIAEIDEIRERYRKQHSINTIVLEDSPFVAIELFNALQRNEVVAMLVDRYDNGGSNSIKVKFFGRALYFPKGPLILAKITDAAIIPAFVVKDGKAYRAIIGKPIMVNDNDVLEHYAQEVTLMFENCIKIYPDQWYNFVEI